MADFPIITCGGYFQDKNGVVPILTAAGEFDNTSLAVVIPAVSGKSIRVLAYWVNNFTDPAAGGYARFLTNIVTTNNPNGYMSGGIKLVNKECLVCQYTPIGWFESEPGGNITAQIFAAASGVYSYTLRFIQYTPGS